MHSLHGPGFALIAITVFCYLQSQHASTGNYLLTAGIAMGIGLISEISQIPGSRNAQLKDLVVNGIGIIGALGLAGSFDKQLRSKIGNLARLSLPAVASIALTITFVPTIWYGYALVKQKQAFPTLLEFEHRWERATFNQPGSQSPNLVQTPAGWPIDGSTIAHAAEAGQWGIFLSLHPLPDWQGYSTLSFVVASTGAEFPMAFCIRDVRPDKNSLSNRFCKRIYVNVTPQRVHISFDEIQSKMEERLFDFSRVEAVVFSASRPGNGMELLIDDIRLEL